METHIVAIEDHSGGLFSSPLSGVCAKGNMPLHAHHNAVEADWSEASFVSISQIAAVAQVQRDCAMRAHMPTSSIRPEHSVDTYISRMNYYKISSIPHSESFNRRNPNGRFMPIEAISAEQNSNDIPDTLCSVVLAHIRTGDTVKDAVSLAFGEVVDNVVQHSDSFCGGIACAQFYPNAGELPYVEYCVADSGRGIAASMAENARYSGMEPSELVAKAFERGTGQWYGRTPDGTSHISGGVGLSISARLSASLGGAVWCVSHDNAVEIRDGRASYISGLYYPGTIVTARLPVASDSVINESDLFDDGECRPMRWNPQDGRYYDDERSWDLW